MRLLAHTSFNFMNNQENEILFLKEQIDRQIEDLKNLRVEVIHLIGENGELHMTLEKCAYWLINIAIKNNTGFECLQKVQELVGDEKYLQIVDAAKQHINDVEEFQNGWKKDSNN